MKMDKLIGERFKETPADCVIDSHALLLRGGYMKQVAGGIFTQGTPLRRITRKIEAILRQEMDALEGQEVRFPLVLPASLWEQSGRFDSVGQELVRLTDRGGSPLVLGMTHEEAAVQLVRDYAVSYQKYPFMIYQIQTKFRDEARPRGGLIRVREFTMKDAYSFHTSQQDLEDYYQKCLEAYHRIFARVGLPQVVSVAAHSGMMGGSLSHEFMLLTPVGEDSIVLCDQCDYRANSEAAQTITRNVPGPREALQLVHTPGAQTIEAVCTFLGSQVEYACKAVVYQVCHSGTYVIAFIRGDYEINEAKLLQQVGQEIQPAQIAADSGLCPGYIGPKDLPGHVQVLFDESLLGISSLVCGANQEGYHYTGLDLQRDCGSVSFVDIAKVQQGGICPICGQNTLHLSRGIEVGNIFQLGTKYTRAMDMQYLDPAGQQQYPVMGCYGIGVGRLAASICEQHHDAHGPIWPLAVAPWQVHICCLRADDPAVRASGEELYQSLLSKGVEVLYDDRITSAGVQFSDADLLGIPLRILVSPRSLAQGCVELQTRDKSFQETRPLPDAIQWVVERLEELNQYNF